MVCALCIYQVPPGISMEDDKRECRLWRGGIKETGECRHQLLVRSALDRRSPDVHEAHRLYTVNSIRN